MVGGVRGNFILKAINMVFITAWEYEKIFIPVLPQFTVCENYPLCCDFVSNSPGNSCTVCCGEKRIITKWRVRLICQSKVRLYNPGRINPKIVITPIQCIIKCCDWDRCWDIHFWLEIPTYWYIKNMRDHFLAILINYFSFRQREI